MTDEETADLEYIRHPLNKSSLNCYEKALIAKIQELEGALGTYADSESPYWVSHITKVEGQEVHHIKNIKQLEKLARVTLGMNERQYATEEIYPTKKAKASQKKDSSGSR